MRRASVTRGTRFVLGKGGRARTQRSVVIAARNLGKLGRLRDVNPGLICDATGDG